MAKTTRFSFQICFLHVIDSRLLYQGWKSRCSQDINTKKFFCYWRYPAEVSSYVFKQLLVFFLKAIDIFSWVLSYLGAFNVCFLEWKHPIFSLKMFFIGLAMHRFLQMTKQAILQVPWRRECCPLLHCHSALTMAHLPSGETHHNWQQGPLPRTNRLPASKLNHLSRRIFI